MEVDSHTIVQCAIPVGATTAKLQDCGNLTIQSMANSPYSVMFRSSLHLIGQFGCPFFLDGTSNRKSTVSNASTRACTYLIIIVPNNYNASNMEFLHACFLFDRHTVNISFPILIQF